MSNRRVMPTRSVAISLPVSLVIALVASLALPRALHADAGPKLQPAPYAAPKYGARFEWRNLGTGETGAAFVRGTAGVKRIWEFDGKRREAIPFCIGCVVEGMIYPFDEYRRLWPLEVGGSIEFRRMLGGDAWMNRVEVVGTESLELEFGPVDVYVVEVESRGITFEVKTWSKRSRVWYAPSLSSAVRIETELENGRLNERRTSRWELIGYQRP